MGYRILFLGKDWYGSCARACGYALRRAGHEVIDVSADGWDLTASRFTTKVLLRMARPLLRAEFNAKVLESARRFSPDLLLAFKGCLLDHSTLRELREKGLPLYQYFPDNSVFAQWSVDPEAMEEYDCCFFTKKFLAADTVQKLRLHDSVYLPHGYDAEIHRRPVLSETDEKIYGADVAVIAVHTAGKEKFLDQLLSLRPNLPLKIWGAGWNERCRSRRVLAKAEGSPLFGQGYVKALATAKINLAILTEAQAGSSGADLTTTRTFEIPACGGFMLHQRTADVLELYEEGSEIECFDSPDEALEKIEFYLAHPAKRSEIANNGYRRAVPAYSYDERMREILAYHEQHRGAVAAYAAHEV